MNHLCLQIAQRLAGNAWCRALSTGLLLGLMFWLICMLRPGDAFASAMGVVLMLSGSASFLLYTLGTSPAMAQPVRDARLKGWIIALSLGVLLAVNGLELLAG